MAARRTVLLAACSLFAAIDAALVSNFTQSYSDGSSLTVQWVNDGVIRVTTVPAGANASFLRFSLEVAQPPVPANAGFTVTDDGTAMVLVTNGSVIYVSKDAPRASLARPDGAMLSGETQPVSHQPESQCGNGHGGPIPGGCLRGYRTLQEGEQIYGFGMQFSTGVNHAGQTIFVQTAAVPGLGQGQSHMPTPFFLSSLGYGMAINSHAYTYFDVGFAEPPGPGGMGTNLIHTADPVMDLYFFTGPNLRGVMGQYTQIYGRTALPPKWALGLWYHPKEDSNQSVIEADAAEFASHAMPLAAVTIEPPWQTHAYACTYVWNNGTIWDPEGFIAAMTGNGTQVTLWQHAYIYNASQGLASPLWDPIYGGGLASDWITWGGATPDWALAQTRSIVTDYFTTNFINKGVAAFKLDECDGGPAQPWFFPDNATFPSGFTGVQMHNLFGMLYGLTYHMMFDALGQRTFLKARAGYMGGQRYPTTAYSDSYDYGQYILAVVNSGFGSFTWAPELRDAGSTSEFARRSQLMLFSGLASEDAWNTGYKPFPPYVDPGASAIYQVYYQARASLQPALYTAYATQYSDGVPAIRSLLMDFPLDLTTLGGVVDQYMFASLLVAPGPIGLDSRSVYFPAGSGQWVDFFNPTSPTLYNASTNVTIDCPDEVLPVFQQVGSVIPMVTPGDASTLRLRAIMPSPASASPSTPGFAPGPTHGPATYPARVYDDDGKTTRYRTHAEYYDAQVQQEVQVTDAGTTLHLRMQPTHSTWRPTWSWVHWEVVVTPRARTVGGRPAVRSLVCGGAAATSVTSMDALIAEGAAGAASFFADSNGMLHLRHRLPVHVGEEANCEVEFAA